jgi:hypothetical protein
VVEKTPTTTTLARASKRLPAMPPKVRFRVKFCQEKSNIFLLVTGLLGGQKSQLSKQQIHIQIIDIKRHIYFV